MPITTSVATAPAAPALVVGDVVHYVSTTCRAAIVTATGPTSLAILRPAGLAFEEDVPYSADITVEGSWHPAQH